jgi:hypothetical protein
LKTRVAGGAVDRFVRRHRALVHGEGLDTGRRDAGYQCAALAIASSLPNVLLQVCEALLEAPRRGVFFAIDREGRTTSDHSGDHFTVDRTPTQSHASLAIRDGGIEPKCERSCARRLRRPAVCKGEFDTSQRKRELVEEALG